MLSKNLQIIWTLENGKLFTVTKSSKKAQNPILPLIKVNHIQKELKFLQNGLITNWMDAKEYLHAPLWVVGELCHQNIVSLGRSDTVIVKLLVLVTCCLGTIWRPIVVNVPLKEENHCSINFCLPVKVSVFCAYISSLLFQCNYVLTK